MGVYLRAKLEVSSMILTSDKFPQNPSHFETSSKIYQAHCAFFE